MPPIEAKLLADFAEPLTAGRAAGGSVPFTDSGGTIYAVSIEKVATGLRIVVRQAKPAAAPPPPGAATVTAISDVKPQAWWAKAPPAASAPERADAGGQLGVVNCMIDRLEVATGAKAHRLTARCDHIRCTAIAGDRDRWREQLD